MCEGGASAGASDEGTARNDVDGGVLLPAGAELGPRVAGVVKRWMNVRTKCGSEILTPDLAEEEAVKDHLLSCTWRVFMEK